MTFNTDNRGFARMLKVKETLFADPVFSAAIAACFNELGFNEPDVALQTSDALKHRHDKSIKDSVWGMMHFAPDEMALINSPIVQRLRRVKQLGFSYLTYPTAEHSRFSHTLGVTHVVKNLLRSIDDMAARQSRTSSLSDDMKSFLEDVGVQVLSHVRSRRDGQNIDRRRRVVPIRIHVGCSGGRSSRLCLLHRASVGCTCRNDRSSGGGVARSMSQSD